MFRVPLLGQIGFALLIATFDGVAPVGDATDAGERQFSLGIGGDVKEQA